MKPEYGIRGLTDELCAAAGFTPQIAFEGDDIATLRGLVEAGLGVGLLPPPHAGGTEQPRPATPHLQVADRGAARQLGLAWDSRPLALARGRGVPRLRRRRGRRDRRRRRQLTAAATTRRGSGRRRRRRRSSSDSTTIATGPSASRHERRSLRRSASRQQSSTNGSKYFWYGSRVASWAARKATNSSAGSERQRSRRSPTAAIGAADRHQQPEQPRGVEQQRPAARDAPEEALVALAVGERHDQQHDAGRSRARSPPSAPSCARVARSAAAQGVPRRPPEQQRAVDGEHREREQRRPQRRGVAPAEPPLLRRAEPAGGRVAADRDDPLPGDHERRERRRGERQQADPLRDPAAVDPRPASAARGRRRGRARRTTGASAARGRATGRRARTAPAAARRARRRGSARSPAGRTAARGCRCRG